MNEFETIINDIINNKTVLEMKKYRQHFSTDCFNHCYDVAYNCYKAAKKLKLDYVSITRAAMLHDLFLYDWRIKGDRKGLHAFTHGKCACDNASKLFDLNEKEMDMIKKHMWPLTIIPPKSIEGFILTGMDKYCASKEMLKYVFR
ncbi:MAG: phosphohydrolase [Bacilli bacterium]|nr:phosphohydrolase [Bacilli bacterium]